MDRNGSEYYEKSISKEKFKYNFIKNGILGRILFKWLFHGIFFQLGRLGRKNGTGKNRVNEKILNRSLNLVFIPKIPFDERSLNDRPALVDLSGQSRLGNRRRNAGAIKKRHNKKRNPSKEKTFEW